MYLYNYILTTSVHHIVLLFLITLVFTFKHTHTQKKMSKLVPTRTRTLTTLRRRQPREAMQVPVPTPTLRRLPSKNDYDWLQNTSKMSDGDKKKMMRMMNRNTALSHTGNGVQLCLAGSRV